ncbi:hypothetical protein [Cyanobium sp. L1E-Cus]|uniref:hypothetical protein n=1 Tax=Cyanobium sp. L1E-Cus TaxID=2823714 RepID=UPI0020CEBAB7|nr:hypothetical protein [Cyanobium sp. L1E-Cus]MCP9823289.1 hypothetical protein [Cyanobium sp. L1E-Cus]
MANGWWNPLTFKLPKADWDGAVRSGHQGYHLPEGASTHKALADVNRPESFLAVCESDF